MGSWREYKWEVVESISGKLERSIWIKNRLEAVRLLKLTLIGKAFNGLITRFVEENKVNFSYAIIILVP